MKLRSVLRLAAVFSVPLLLAPLTGGCDSADDDDSAVPIDQLPAQLAAAQCDVRRRCAGPQQMIHLGSVEYCQESLGDHYSDYTLPPIAAAAAAGTVVYHGERVRECGVSAGARCTLAYPSQCPDGQHCLHTNLLQNDIDGTCGAPAKPGQDCYYWQSPCEADAQCNSKCAAVKDVGSPCDDDGDCHSGNCKNELGAPREACQL